MSGTRSWRKSELRYEMIMGEATGVGPAQRWRPEAVHGFGMVGPFFEGRCAKIVATRAYCGLLHSPEGVAMLQRVMESLTATMQVRLVEINSGRVVFADTGRHAGLEGVGDLSGLGAIA